MPFVTAEDIGHAAGEVLLGPAPASGHPRIQEIQGERDLSMNDVARVLGELTGNRNPRYARQSLEEFAADQRAAGVSGNVAAVMIEVAEAINSGHTRTPQARDFRTTTPTSVEHFGKAVLLPALEEHRPGAHLQKSF
ncbi:hypothetical protein [Amycolatopsis sp. H20-H5]|uniref:hypothetical protein n=1 Tax=Amycolatopsis sp. H20-H5 TaxID=3046309 RepID=UPI002DBAEC45|nr:hypothetical protein [Amycolatopsis sp. H20-H5]MEC3978232.1 hypothetical protein [Amycolatopsis sp. H20-H5]